MLLARSFSIRWIGWIMSLLKTGNSSIMIKGILGNKIQSKCGLRQSDPLSPVLLNLVVNVFAKNIKVAIGNEILENVGNEVTRDGLLVLQFVDDIILFYFSLT